MLHALWLPEITIRQGQVPRILPIAKARRKCGSSRPNYCNNPASAGTVDCVQHRGDTWGFPLNEERFLDWA
jgi:hypothetical protein